jgi:hypothetical protein
MDPDIVKKVNQIFYNVRQYRTIKTLYIEGSRYKNDHYIISKQDFYIITKNLKFVLVGGSFDECMDYLNSIL